MLKFCVDIEYLEFSLICGYINSAKTYMYLKNVQVCAFLDQRSEETQESTTIEQLDKLIMQHLRTKMNRNAKARIEDLFSSYVTLLSINGLI